MRVAHTTDDTHSTVTLLAVIVAAAVFALLASIVFNWASGKSAMWNLGFGAVIVLGGAVLLLAIAVLLMRRFAN